MARPTAKEFTPEVVEKLQHYVYRLIDPRNGETFYIGKGKGNRIFAHARGDIEVDGLTEKMSRIRAIILAGFEVTHIVHRHGLGEKTAFEVEAALIDAYPGISNIMDGHGNSEFGAMHSEEIIRHYTVEDADFKHKAVIISVNRSALEYSLYEATRYAWRLDPKKASQASVVLATVRGLIVGAFKADEWLEATSENFPGLGRETIEGRYGFVGKKASIDFEQLYVNKRVPDKYRKKGASNPVKYTW